jgi:2-phosphoglycerate kinase
MRGLKMNYGNIKLLRKKIDSLKKSLVIFIYGAPGTSKSSTAVQLAANLGINVVAGTDQIRDAVRLYFDNPFLKRPTHICWELIGNRTKENIIKGYLEQSALMKEAVLGTLELAKKRGENMIFEGVHLFPDLYAELKNDPDLTFFSFLLWVGDESLHRKIIATKVNLRHGKEKDWSKEKIEEIREIQKFLLEQKAPHVYSIDHTTPRENTAKILKVLEESL